MTMRESDLLAASCRVALAAYLHDLGKFAERARIDVPKDALDAHVTQYCPQRFNGPSDKRGYHTHKHAAYTGLAFDLVESTAPDLIQGEMHPFINRSQLQADHTQATDSLINAAAAHHRPATFLQWIIATADRVASGFERDEFDKYNESKDENTETATGRNHYQARQLSLFEQIRLDGKLQKITAKDLEWRYPLKALSPSVIFPQKRKECEPSEDGQAQAEYKWLWCEFLVALESIPKSHRSNWALWLDHFDTAWMTFTHAIPAATAFGIKPEVSLYDHSKTTAALATALWRWHEDSKQIGEPAANQLKERSDWNVDKFLMIQGDFFGIQDFIFADGSQTNKAAAKLLRGRSFQVSLFTELAALKVLDALSLPPTSQITNAAGKFLIVAPNTPDARAQLETARTEINQWFLQHSFGLAGLGLIGKPASCNDFLKGRFGALQKSLFAELERAKLQRFDLTAPGNPVFDVDYPHGICQYNGRLPVDDSSQKSAALSRDQITLGSVLTREDRLLIVRDPAMLTGRGLRTLEVPVFGYGVAFTQNEAVTGKFGALAQDGTLQRCWDFSLPVNLTETLWHGYARPAATWKCAGVICSFKRPPKIENPCVGGSIPPQATRLKRSVASSLRSVLLCLMSLTPVSEESIPSRVKVGRILGSDQGFPLAHRACERPCQYRSPATERAAYCLKGHLGQASVQDPRRSRPLGWPAAGVRLSFAGTRSPATNIGRSSHSLQRPLPSSCSMT